MLLLCFLLLFEVYHICFLTSTIRHVFLNFFSVSPIKCRMADPENICHLPCRYLSSFTYSFLFSPIASPIMRKISPAILKRLSIQSIRRLSPFLKLKKRSSPLQLLLSFTMIICNPNSLLFLGIYFSNFHISDRIQAFYTPYFHIFSNTTSKSVL